MVKGFSTNSGPGSQNSGHGNLAQPERMIRPPKPARSQELEVEHEVENEIKDEFDKEASGAPKFESHFPISFDASTGGLIVRTGHGFKPIRVLPEHAAAIARTVGIGAKLEKIELTEETNKAVATDSASFKVTSIKFGKLFGFIPVSGEQETQVGAQTGTVLSNKQPLIFQLLSFFITQ